MLELKMQRLSKIKLIIIIVILFLIGVGAVIGKSFFLKTYKGIAKVIERVDFNHIIVELDIDTSIQMDIYSSFFDLDDKIEIEYTKKWNKYVITKITTLAKTRLEKAKLLGNIKNNAFLHEYKSKISGYNEIEPNEFADINKREIYDFYILPKRISKQYYETIGAEEYYNIKNYLSDGIDMLLEKDTKAVLNIDSEVKILSLKNINEDKTVDVKFKKKGNSIAFKALGHGIYELQVKFKNGDIINYIFT